MSITDPPSVEEYRVTVVVSERRVAELEAAIREWCDAIAAWEQAAQAVNVLRHVLHDTAALPAALEAQGAAWRRKSDAEAALAALVGRTL